MKILNEQELFEMARVGFVNNYEVYINTNDDGKIPHFHLRDSDDWSKFHSCIKITDAEYFNHGPKVDTLNSSERKSLDNFMKSKVLLSRYKDKFANNWELVCFLWDMNNSDVSISEDVTQPDYTELQ